MAEVGDTTGARAFDLETSERVPLGLPTSCYTQRHLLPVLGVLHSRVLTSAVGPDPHRM